jgi:hypothetical protein
MFLLAFILFIAFIGLAHGADYFSENLALSNGLAVLCCLSFFSSIVLFIAGVCVAHG